jgi:ribonuclease BN (tRNA processing enzyme)
VKVRFLGSGDAFGSGGRFQTCIHVESGASQLLLDCGASSLIAMRRFGVDPQAIDTVILSHLHGDHFGGVPFLILDGQFKRRTRPLLVAGPARRREASARRHGGVLPRLDPNRAEVRDALRRAGRSRGRRGRAGSRHGLRGVPCERRAALCAADHRGGQDRHLLGRHEWTESLVDAARGADLFIAEALSYDKRIRYHLDLATLLEHRSRLDCRRLILTHMGEDVLARLDGLAVETAEDGKQLLV